MKQENEQGDKIVETKVQHTLRTWEGEIRTEQVNRDLFSEEEQSAILSAAKQDCTFEELHENWFIDFLKKGGLEALMNILNAFITKQTGHLNSAESKCLNLAAYIIKVILVGCFSADDALGLSTNLIRKMSSTN